MTFSFAESEYSPEAESIYAAFLAGEDTGNEAFEELCAVHEELADELEGLHGDFAGVAGVLARMGGSTPRPVTSAPVVEAPAGDAAAAESATSAPSSEPALDAKSPARRILVGLGAISLLAACAWLTHEVRIARAAEIELADALEQEARRLRFAEEEARLQGEARSEAEDEAGRQELRAMEAEERLLLLEEAARLRQVAAHLEAARLDEASELLDRLLQGEHGPASELLAARLDDALRRRARVQLAETAFRPLDPENIPRAVKALELLEIAAIPASVKLPPAGLGSSCSVPSGDIELLVELCNGRLLVHDPRLAEPLVELGADPSWQALGFDGAALWIRRHDDSLQRLGPRPGS